MTPKFKFEKTNNVTIMDEKVKKKRTDYINSLPDGVYIDSVRREGDTSPMNAFFHGPVRDFILAEEAKLNPENVLTLNGVKDDMKEMFGKQEPHTLFNGSIKWEPMSTADYEFDDWKLFLQRIGQMAMARYKYPLPTIEEVE